MQHKWVTWLLQMFRCILSQFISLWDYCIAYLQQKYGHLSRMSSNSGRVEDSVQYRSLGPRVEAGSGVRGYSQYAHPGFISPAVSCSGAGYSLACSTSHTSLSSNHGGYDGRGQRSCKCNYVDFYKDARPPCWHSLGCGWLAGLAKAVVGLF